MAARYRVSSPNVQPPLTSRWPMERRDLSTRIRPARGVGDARACTLAARRRECVLDSDAHRRLTEAAPRCHSPRRVVAIDLSPNSSGGRGHLEPRFAQRVSFARADARTAGRQPCGCCVHTANLSLVLDHPALLSKRPCRAEPAPPGGPVAAAVPISSGCTTAAKLSGNVLSSSPTFAAGAGRGSMPTPQRRRVVSRTRGSLILRRASRRRRSCTRMPRHTVSS